MRLINKDGEQVGIVDLYEAQRMAEQVSLDLVEVVATAHPPVCKIMNYGKFRYDQTKKEKESKKSQHQVKIKEIKLKPNIDEHDLETKTRHARDFLEKGHKVKLSCVFRGREMAHPEFGQRIIDKLCDALEDVSIQEVPPKMFGRTLTAVIAPGQKKEKISARKGEGSRAQNENQ